MNYYEAKKAARIDRMRERAVKKAEFAQNNGLDLFGEAKSGIPMGQPILVGHHSEGRHRRHLERIENRVRKGFEAAEQAEELESRADAAESRTAIDSDNPEAIDLVTAKIERLEKLRDQYKAINVLVRTHRCTESLGAALASRFPDLKEPTVLATKMLTPDFMGRIGIPGFTLTNMGAEIRRLKKRLPQLARVQQGFDPIEVNGIKVELFEGQLQINFGYKPSEETRTMIKGLAFKWSRYSEKWVRKHTATTASRYFLNQLTETLKEAKP